MFVLLLKVPTKRRTTEDFPTAASPICPEENALIRLYHTQEELPFVMGVQRLTEKDEFDLNGLVSCTRSVGHVIRGQTVLENEIRGRGRERE